MQGRPPTYDPFKYTGPTRVEAQPLLANSQEVAPCPFINKGGGISPCQHEDTGLQPPFKCHHEDTILGNPLPLPQNPRRSGNKFIGHYPCVGDHPEPDKSMSFLIHTVTL